jgi:ribosome recycling factor
VAYDFSKLKKAVADKEEWLRKELAGIRTGRATSALLDGIQVEAYGSRSPLNQIAGITTEDAKTLRVQPWDVTLVKAIEKAITVADLGVSLSTDESSVRVIFPDLTSERRQQLAKLVRERLEDAKVAMRGAREEAWSDIQKREKDGGLGEDEKFRAKDEMEKLVKEGNERLDELAKKKEEEVTTL